MPRLYWSVEDACAWAVRDHESKAKLGNVLLELIQERQTQGGAASHLGAVELSVNAATRFLRLKEVS